MFSHSFIAVFLLLASSLLRAESPLFKDDFSAAKLTERRMARGPWQVVDHVASCVQDDAEYAKAKDHGPIIFYDQAYQDATLRFSYKAEGSKTVVFTANGEKGHVFRFVASAAATSVRAFVPDEEHKSVELDKGPALKLDEWVDVAVELRGNTATVTIGKDYEKTVKSDYLSTAKTNFSIGFSFGKLSVKSVSLQRL